MPGRSVGVMTAGLCGVRTGLQSRCFLVLAILGREVAAADVRAFLRGEGEDVSYEQVRAALAGLCRAKTPLAERSVQGSQGQGHVSWYRLTEHGRQVIAEE